MIFPCTNTDQFSNFLVDTQADISVIKISSLTVSSIIRSDNIINIIGVTDGSVKSLGTIQTQLLLGDNEYPVDLEFTVVPANFPIPVDGIIGKDFIKAHNCLLDYKQYTFSITVDDKTFNVPIHSNDQLSNYHLLPARCEVIRHFNLQCDSKHDQVILHQEIHPGVFISNAIVDPKSCFLRILNTNFKPLEIRKTLKLETSSLDNFSFIEHSQYSSNRDEELKPLLQNAIPKHAPESLFKLCSNYSDIFALPNDKHSVNNFYKQNFTLADTNPVYIKNYRYPHSQKVEIDRQVESMLKQKIIEPSCSNYNSPIILVPKKAINGVKKYRLCIDFRQLNKKLIPDKFPLPRIEDILDNLGRTKYFSTLDLHSGFWQIPLEESSKNLTSFSTDRGSYRFNVLPFGLNVAPNSFARMMSIAFSGLSPSTAFIYLDDVIVIGTSAEHHLENLEKVFKLCRSKNLKLNPEKCHFMQSEVTYLGHKCTDKGILPDNSKLITIQDYPAPTDQDGVKRFVAFCNYYRKFIPNFASIAYPLNSLTRKKSIFQWSSDCDTSFKQLKNALISPPILQYPDFNRTFYITVDACKTGIGAVLSQYNDNDDDLPIAFASKSFTKGERNKATIEQELLAIHFGIKHFRPYVYGTKFIIRSDHKPLSYLFSLKDPTSKLARIRLDLTDYNFIIEHIKGSDNVAADALSRIEFDNIKNVKGTDPFKILALTRSKAKASIQNEILGGVQTAMNNLSIKKLPFLQFLFKESTDGDLESSFLLRSARLTSSRKLIFNPSSVNSYIDMLFTELNFVLLKKKFKEIRINPLDDIFKYISLQTFKELAHKNITSCCIWIMQPITYIESAAERQKIIEHFHTHMLEGGHSGQKRLYEKIRSKYRWKYMRKDIATFVKKCSSCQINKPKVRNKEGLIITDTPNKPFETLIIDTIGPFPSTTNQVKYAVTIICDFSKYLIIVPIPNKEAKTIAKVLLEHCILIYGPFKSIRSDLGTEYANKLMKELTELLNIQHDTSTAYHHETLGTIERSHKTLNEYLRNYSNEDPKEWSKLVKYFSFCYNTTPNTTINMYTPFELVYGRRPNMLFNFKEIENKNPINNINQYIQEIKSNLDIAFKRTKQFLESSKIKTKNLYDSNCKPINVNIGDNVLLINEIRNKLDPLFKIGYKVVEIHSNNNVTLQNLKNNQHIVVHKNKIRNI